MKKILLLSVAISTCVFGASADNVTSTESRVEKIGNVASYVQKDKGNDMQRIAIKANSALKASEITPASATETAGMSISYANPVNFYVGSTEDGVSMTGNDNVVPYLMMPAYADLTWKNLTTGATSYAWEYIDPTFETEDPLTTTTTDLTVTYPWAQLINPTLKAANDNGSGSYVYDANLLTGGNLSFSQDGENYLFGAAMYNIYSMMSWTSWEPAGMSDTGDENISSSLGVDAKVVGFGNLYPAPATPYAVSRVWATVDGQWEAGAVIDVTLYSLKNGLPNEVLAYGSYTSATAHTPTTGYMSGCADIAVDLQHEVDGFVSTGFITVSDSVYVEISTSDAKVTSLYPIGFISGNEEDWFQLNSAGTGIASTEEQKAKLSACWQFTFEYEGETYAGFEKFPYFYSFSGLDSYGYWNPTAYMIDMDARFGWLTSSAEGGNIVIPTNGGESDVTYLSCYYEFNESLFVESDLDMDGVIDDASWLSYELIYPEYDEAAGSGTNGQIIFTADALEGAGRSAQVEISVIGAEPIVLTVSQGTVGVSSVEAAQAANVTVEGGNFVVTAPESINFATVYNMAGQAVAASEIAGNTTIDAQSLAKGVYVVRFNDGSNVKVIK